MGSFPLHEIGVAVLFTISGYLITKSWLSDPHPIRFAVRRFFGCGRLFCRTDSSDGVCSRTTSF